MSYRESFTSINDWEYFNRLLSFQWVAKKETTKAYCYALVNSNQSKGVNAQYVWWKLKRSNYKLTKQQPKTGNFS